VDRNKLGLGIADLRLPVREGLEQAGRLGYRVVQIGVNRPEVEPARLSESGRRHLARCWSSLGLRASSLADEPGGRGLADSAVVDARVHRTLQVLTLAADLRVPVVTADVGPILDPKTDEPSPTALEALRAIAERADGLGTFFAIETTADRPDGLLRAVQTINCPWVKLCLDPALLACFGHDPMAAVGAAGDAVVLSHLGDAAMGRPDRPGFETPLGEGQVDLHRYLAGLAAGGYAGPLIVRRRESTAPAEEFAAAREKLESLLP